MAVLALASAGALGASALGMSAGMGWTIGTLLGNALFPGKLPDQNGPRLADTRVQQSRHGAPIAVVWGRKRVAGNVLWSTKKLPTTVTTRSGGKGTPSQKSTRTTYRVSWAIELCEGEIHGIRKIWANGRLIYSVGEDADPATVAASNLIAPGIAIYLGTETQLPDPTIVAYEGASVVSAYRGKAYLVLTDFQLEEYGNQPPQIEAEVVSVGSSSTGFTRGVLPAAAAPYNGIATDGSLFVQLLRSNPGGVCTSTNGIDWSYLIPILPAVTNLLNIHYGLGKWVIGTSSALAYVSNNGTSYVTRTVPHSGMTLFADNGNVMVGICPDTANAMFTEDGDNWFSASMPSLQTWSSVQWVGPYFLAIAWNGTLARSFDGRGWSAFGNVGFGTNWRKLASNGTSVVITAWDATFGRSLDGGATWAPRTAAVSQWRGLEWTGDYYIACGNGLSDYAATSFDDGDTWTTYSRVDLIADAFDDIAIAGGVTVFGGSSGAPAGTAVVRFGVITPGAVTSGDIILSICERAGLSPAQVDVSEMTDPVIGYGLGRQLSAAAALEPILMLARASAVEGAGELKFVKRDRAPVVTIREGDLGARLFDDDPVEPLGTIRGQEAEVPAAVTVVYENADNNYEQGSQTDSVRQFATDQSLSLEVPVVMTDDQAKQLAKTFRLEARVKRTRHTLRLPRSYARLEPGDVVTLGARSLFLESRTESPSGIFAFRCTAYRQSVYSHLATGGASVPAQSTVRSAPVCSLRMIDGPLFRDEDNVSAPLSAAVGVTEGWRGASLYLSADSGATYDEVAGYADESASGYAGFTLGGYTGGNTFDLGNAVDITLFGEATLSNASDEALFNGANLCLLGGEALQFGIAQQIAARTWRLFRLLRGRRGTESFVNTHVQGEAFTLMTPGSIRRVTAPLSLARLYKVVGVGRSIQESTPQTFTYTGVNLKPFSPSTPIGYRNAAGDIILGFSRRSRLGASLNTFLNPPLGEAITQYEVEFWNATYTVLRRAFTGLATPTVTYTAAQQTTDGGAANPAYYRIFQMSSTVGRGYPLQGTI